MTWLLYRWVWKLEAPLYVGATPAGSLNRCRLHVPARALWGALTAEYARSVVTTRERPDYEKWGSYFREYIRLGYLFPAERGNGEWKAWLPFWEEGRGLVWRREDRSGNDRTSPDRLFRTRLLHTRPATAIDPATETVAEGSLRETECWNTVWRLEDGSPGGPVGLVGYLFLRDATDRLDPTRLPGTIFLGGDTRYGLGRIVRENIHENMADFFGADVQAAAGDPVVSCPSLLAHAPYCGNDLRGNIECLAGWNFRKIYKYDEKLFWSPGSMTSDHCPTKWSVARDGTWRISSAT